MNRSMSFLISVAVLAACGPNEASIYEEGDKDVGQSKKITLAEWKERPWKDKLWEHAASLLGPLL